MVFSAAILALLTAVLLAARRGAVRDTTLSAPLYWAVFSLVALGAVECLAGLLQQRPVWLAHVRFMAAGTTFCPLMAVLGAKRPQDRGWQVVVVTLLGVLVFYCLTDLAYWPDAPPSLPWVVRWLLVLPLVGMGLLNNLPTRFWPSALLATAGQVLLLSPVLPEVQAVVAPTADAARLIGMVCLAAAVLLWAVDFPRCKAPPPSVDRLWLDFRNAFGSFWALRLAARFNQSAEMFDWGVILSWHGLTVLDQDREIDPEIEAAIRKSLRSLLRRFVDPGWIDRRLG